MIDEGRGHTSITTILQHKNKNKKKKNKKKNVKTKRMVTENVGR